MDADFLFLGFGETTKQWSSWVPGEVWALEELNTKSLRILEKVKSDWIEREIRPGNLDDFSWSIDFLGAKVALSPGIDPRRPFFKWVKEREIRELDYFCQNFRGHIIGITGTDGKSTFTTQLGEILRRLKGPQDVFVGGNLGPPMMAALSTKASWAVLELSSYQCERLKSAQLWAGVLLNLAPDHLNRYDRLSDYYAAKWELIRRSKRAFYPFNLDVPTDLKTLSCAKWRNGEEMMSILEMVSKDLAKQWKLKIPESLFLSLPVLPHRLEKMEDDQGRVYFNDSKATTVHAACYGIKKIQSQFKKLHLLFGGRPKGESFLPLNEVIRKEDEVYIYGQARDLLASDLADQSPKSFPHLREALQESLQQLKPREALLLSPACASFDEFENFEKRGQFFVDFLKRNVSLKELNESDPSHTSAPVGR